MQKSQIRYARINGSVRVFFFLVPEMSASINWHIMVYKHIRSYMCWSTTRLRLIYYIHYISHPLCHAYADDIQFYVQFKPENPIDESKTVDAWWKHTDKGYPA